MVKKYLDNPTSEDFDLTILPAKKDSTGIPIRRPYHPMLPKVDRGALTLILGKVNSGKSNLALNLFLNPNFYKDCWDTIYVFSESLHADQTLKKLVDTYPATCYDHFDENRLQRIFDYQLSQPEDEREAIAIFFDDLPNYLRPKSLFHTCATNYRHKFASLFYSVQSFKMIPPVVRNNATNVFMGVLNQSQVDQVTEEFGDQFGGKDNFKKYYGLAVPEKWNWLYMRLDEHPPILHKNLDEKILYQEQQ